jgi:carbonic anhydrase
MSINKVVENTQIPIVFKHFLFYWHIIIWRMDENKTTHCLKDRTHSTQFNHSFFKMIGKPQEKPHFSTRFQMVWLKLTFRALLVSIQIYSITAIALPNPNPSPLNIQVGKTNFARNYEKLEFGYKGKTGPSNWGDLDQSWALCKTGKTQSPIDINQNTTGSIVAEVTDKVAVDWQPIINSTLHFDGHSLVIDIPETSSAIIMYDSITYRLKNIHIHSNSEHLIFGKEFAMELHFVHKSADGKLLVTSVLVEQKPTSHPFFDIYDTLPQNYEDVNVPVIVFNYLLGTIDLKKVYEYKGSLTTPPCSEKVQWIVAQNFTSISKDTLKHIKKILPKPSNARPVQRS